MKEIASQSRSSGCSVVLIAVAYSVGVVMIAPDQRELAGSHKRQSSTAGDLLSRHPRSAQPQSAHAVSAIMGHADASMAGVYRERVDDARLVAVSEVVRHWLWPDGP